MDAPGLLRRPISRSERVGLVNHRNSRERKRGLLLNAKINGQRFTPAGEVRLGNCSSWDDIMVVRIPEFIR